MYWTTCSGKESALGLAIYVYLLTELCGTHATTHVSRENQITNQEEITKYLRHTYPSIYTWNERVKNTFAKRTCSSINEVLATCEDCSLAENHRTASSSINRWPLKKYLNCHSQCRPEAKINFIPNYPSQNTAGAVLDASVCTPGGGSKCTLSETSLKSEL